VVYLRGRNYACREIAGVVRVDADTATEYVRKYRDGGLAGRGARLLTRGQKAGRPAKRSATGDPTATRSQALAGPVVEN